MVTAAIVVASLLAVGLYTSISLGRFLRKERIREAELHALPRTPIKDLVVGSRVRIVGIAHGSDLLKSPYSGTPCIAFHGESNAKIHHSNDSTGWTEKFEGPTVHELRPFFIDDGTGKIAVAIDHANLDLELPPVSKDQVEAHVFGAKVIARETSSTSYAEWLLAPDTRAGIIGTVGRGDDGGLRIVGTAESPVVISNRPAALVA
jgi:hypothetical protein